MGSAPKENPMLGRHAGPSVTSISVRLAKPLLGRRKRVVVAGAEPRAANALADDLRLFALTFAGGFLFMAVYLA